MKLTKLIITKQKDVLQHFKCKFDLHELYSEAEFTIFEGKRELHEDDEQILFMIFTDFNKALSYIQDEFDIFKIIIAGTAKNLGNIDIREGDIVLPNSFISTTGEGTVFLEYAIGEDYDLEKFKVILNGICATGEVHSLEEDDFYADIQDEYVFDILKSLEEKNLTKQTVVVKSIIGEEKVNLDNLVSITEFVL